MEKDLLNQLVSQDDDMEETAGLDEEEELDEEELAEEETADADEEDDDEETPAEEE